MAHAVHGTVPLLIDRWPDLPRRLNDSLVSEFEVSLVLDLAGSPGDGVAQRCTIH